VDGARRAVHGAQGVQGPIGPNSPFIVDDATNNAVTNVLTLSHDTSGSPAAGIGTGLAFQAETSTTVDTALGTLQFSWSTVTHASRRGKFELTVQDAGTTRTPLTITTDGTRATSTWAGTVSNPGAGGLRNEVFGVGAGIVLTTNGNDNVLGGYNAGTSLTSGARCVVLGATAFDAASTATDAVAIGYDALGAYTTGTTLGNIAIGAYSLHSHTNTGASAYSLAVGYEAAYSHNGPGSILAIGYQAGKTFAGNSTAGNVYVGHNCADNATGTLHSFVGTLTGRNANGSECTGMGWGAMAATNTAVSSCFFGRNSMNNYTGSGTVTAYGAYSAYHLTTGSEPSRSAATSRRRREASDAPCPCPPPPTSSPCSASWPRRSAAPPSTW
jgi:hypothetical protein